MDKETLLKIAKGLNCEYEIGLVSEINDFLECQENVSDFKLSYNGTYFLLKIGLKEFGLMESKTIFSLLVSFIEYTSTFYVREDFEEYIEYTLLSAMRSKKAFLCTIIFN